MYIHIKILKPKKNLLKKTITKKKNSKKINKIFIS